jgi:penicillin G amidase
MRFRRIVGYLALFLVIVLVIAGAGLYVVFNQWSTGPLPQHEGTLQVAGLQAQVEIIRDTWGVPHIYASNSHDLFFAQGYTQAQDRWWQMEFSRHIGNGSLQELTGKNEDLLGTDIFIRSVGWRRASEADYARLDELSKTRLQAFADGVNAYTSSRPAGQLAFEYNVLGVTSVKIPIEPWTPVDTLVWTKVMSWDLSGNESEELDLSDLIAAYGEDMARDFAPDYPYGDKPTIIQPEDLPEAGETFDARVSYGNGIVGVDTSLAGNFDTDEGFMLGSGDGIGSNNWVVAGKKSETGMPLLANDPHLSIGMPSIWYEIGLHCQPVSEECPFNVRGLTFSPGVGVVIGHNDTIAWGVTNVGPDTQDLYVIKVNPDNLLQYEWDGDWRDMTVVDEVIRYGDSTETLTIQVRITHLGPIINDNDLDDAGNPMGFNNEDPLALRWTALDSLQPDSETGSTITTSIFDINTATNWDEFRAALRLWDTPSQNFVFADIEGNIGYQTPSSIPVRAEGHTGVLPIDGSVSKYEWLGYVPFENLPSVWNPERGYIATANQALVPESYYAQLADEDLGFAEGANFAFGYQWAYGHRGQRIVEMLEATEKHSIESFQAIQGDNKLIVAEELTPYLTSLDFEDATLNDARTWMLDWDYQMHRDSPQGALFGMFWMELMKAAYMDQLEPLDLSTNGSGQQMWATYLLIDKPDNAWWDDISTKDITETRDDIVRQAFKAAYDALVARQGSDRNAWRWGKLHTATFVSDPLGASGIAPIENMVNRGPVEASGATDAVNATGWNEDLTVRAVPSMRMIVDVSDFSNSRIVHTTGQSGHPFSPQYEDMIEPWLDIDYHPMLWTREEVEANAAQSLTLEPGN